ncbi:hypothetical protein NRS6120_05325 [Bacillus subtilis]|nr:hypothetical protein NRS6120_03991 [Bacillus subtilis]CAI6243149.1 hypothetical protein NRS6120_05325 [Bacillus subtilis]
MTECNITRQAFYYHFQDIPEVLSFLLKENEERIKEGYDGDDSSSDRLRYILQVSLRLIPYIRKGMNTNYRDEIEQIISEQITGFMKKKCEDSNALDDYTQYEKDMLIRYHSQAVIGLMKGMTPKDEEHIDEIVHVLLSIVSNAAD